MKHQKIIIALLLQTVSLTLIAQKERVRGIYKTGDDFKTGKISFDNDCTTKRKIRLNDFFMQPYITIKENDSSLTILKTDIFGYRNCNNEIFRFKGKQELLLLNTSGQILIYKLQNNNPPAGSRTNVTNYYFSYGANSPVEKLTIKNLKKTFPDNHSFHHLIDENFKYNTDLAGFDKSNSIFKINLLFNESLR